MLPSPVIPDGQREISFLPASQELREGLWLSLDQGHLARGFFIGSNLDRVTRVNDPVVPLGGLDLEELLDLAFPASEQRSLLA